MAVPSFDRATTLVWTPVSGDGFSASSPGLLSATAAGTLTYDTGSRRAGPNQGGTHTASTWYGARVDFTGSVLDFTGGDYIILHYEFTTYNFMSPGACGEALASGGNVRVLFEDSAGNYAGWIILAEDSFDNPWFPGQFGGSVQSFIGRTNGNAMNFLVHRDATADWSSGTVDWTDIEGIEIHVQSGATNGTFGLESFVGSVSSAGPWTITDGDVSDPGSFTNLQVRDFGTGSTQGYGFPADPTGSGDGPYWKPWHIYALDIESAATKGYLGMNSGEIGDGATTTRFEDSSFGIHWCLTRDAYEDTPPGASSGKWYWMIDDGVTRYLQINTSASCYVELSAFFMEGYDVDGGTWNFYVIGNSSATVAIFNFTMRHANVLTLEHGTYTNGTFQDVEEVEVTTNTTMAACSIADTAATSKGLYIDGAPGDYSGLDVRFASTNAGDDITINPSSTGTYNLTGISADSGHTVAIHNESASTAITVQVPAGITTSTTTAGGTVTVEPPDLDVTITCVDTGGTAIKSARVRVVTDPGGTVVLEGLTATDGTITDTYSGSTPQAITGTARRASTGLGATLYKPASIIGSIGASGLDQTVVMIEDA